MLTNEIRYVLPVLPSQLDSAETDLARARQRYQASKSACLEMYGSLSILVVPQSDYKILADASYQAHCALMRLGDLKARHRAEMSIEASASRRAVAKAAKQKV